MILWLRFEAVNVNLMGNIWLDIDSYLVWLQLHYLSFFRSFLSFVSLKNYVKSIIVINVKQWIYNLIFFFSKHSIKINNFLFEKKKNKTKHGENRYNLFELWNEV